MSKSTFVLKNKAAHPISPDMIGLFFEDINFAADGGLYAELIENRSFEAVKSKGKDHNYILREDNLYAWSSIDGDETCLEISMNQPISSNNPHYLRFTSKKDGQGFKNKAYDGISLKKNLKYNISFYAREVQYPEGKILVKVTKEGKTYAETTIDFNNGKNPPKDWYTGIIADCDMLDWALYKGELTANDDIQGADFEIILTKKGSVEFDLISMIPEDAIAGIFRKDLFNALKDIHPGFIRFPGGCIIEGTSLMRRYQWKNTVGPLKDRKINTNLWALRGGNTLGGNEMPDCHYMQSYGLGFYEFFLLCELLSSEKRVCKPLPVLNIGLACQFRTYEVVPIDSPEFNNYIQDALDLIEFANGPVDSKWGKLRAEMGHPESFKMDMIAIGNEQWESKRVDLAPRYVAFEKAIHEKYPEIKCLGTAGPWVKHELYDKAWELYREKIKTNKTFTYAVDEHYYVAPEWLYENVVFYDNYPRDVGVFAGEYAAHDKNLSNSVEAAMSEAAMMTGYERNGDVVKLASYAPLFNRIGHSQWTPDLIWFDADKVVLTPSYYVQKIFSDYSGNEALELDGQEKGLREKKLYISALKNGENKIVKIVNGGDEEQTLVINGEDGKCLEGEVEIAKLMAKSGTAKKIVATDTIGPESGNKSISPELMTNKELCDKRAPEEVSYTVEKVKFEGEVKIPAKSLLIVKF
jgi:alpha-L-arabinofuranosidase